VAPIRAAIRAAVAIAVRLLPDLLIVAGVGTAIGGLYLLVGLAWTLLAAGIVTAGYGAALDLRGTPRWHS
jgi:Na+/H+ antiporter NhaB